MSCSHNPSDILEAALILTSYTSTSQDKTVVSDSIMSILKTITSSTDLHDIQSP